MFSKVNPLILYSIPYNSHINLPILIILCYSGEKPNSRVIVLRWSSDVSSTYTASISMYSYKAGYMSKVMLQPL